MIHAAKIQKRKAYQQAYYRLNKTKNKLEWRGYVPATKQIKLEYLPIDGSRPYCLNFGCGKQLSLIESLAGNVCISCMK